MLFKPQEPSIAEVTLRMVNELSARVADQDKALDEIVERLRRVETRLCLFLVREGHEDIVSKPKEE